MNFLTNYASRLHERASYSGKAPIVDYLNETLGQVSRDIQAIVMRSTANNEKCTPPAPVAANGIPTLKVTNTSGANFSQNEWEMFQNFMNYMKMSQTNKSNNNENNSGEHKPPPPPPPQSNGSFNIQDQNHFSS